MLIYTKKEFARRLKCQLEGDFDVVRIARWAFHEYHEHGHRVANDLDPIIQDVFFMEEGPQFEMTREQLLALVNSILNQSEEK